MTLMEWWPASSNCAAGLQLVVRAEEPGPVVADVALAVVRCNRQACRTAAGRRW